MAVQTRVIRNLKDRLRMWAAAFREVSDVRVMSAPPTVTLPDSNLSTINGSNNAASLPAAGKYTQLDLSGYASTKVLTGNPNNNGIQLLGPANTDGSDRGATLGRVRFSITVPQFEVCFSEVTGAKIGAVVDGEFVDVFSGVIPPGLQSNNTRYLKFDFGADTLSYGMASANLGVGGSGYVRGERIQLVGGTYTKPAIYVARAVSGGAITVLTLADPGDYTVLPTFPASTISLSGSGTGATVATGFTFPRHTTLKPRNVELFIAGTTFYGINYTSPSTEAVIGKYARNPLSPKLYWLGDSQDAPTYALTEGTEIGHLVARRLGLSDNLTIDAQGGTGFNVNNGVAPAFEHANRIAALVAAQPDIVFFPYSQNVGSNTQATSQAAALSFITQLQAALPNAVFIMCGPAYGYQAWHLAAMQYVMANVPDPTRIRMIDTITEGWATGNSSGYLTTDTTHWGVWGNLNWRSKILANRIKDCLFDMLT